MTHSTKTQFKVSPVFRNLVEEKYLEKASNIMELLS